MQREYTGGEGQELEFRESEPFSPTSEIHRRSWRLVGHEKSPHEVTLTSVAPDSERNQKSEPLDRCRTETDSNTVGPLD